MTTRPIVAPRKLIEVALPLDKINEAAAREKSIRHGHPSTLHLWWARRPLAAARAVLFAQLVNDPSWKYSEEEQKKPQVKGAITRKRNELFRLIEDLVKWENTTNESVLSRARAEIRASWRETCEANKDHPDPEVRKLFAPEKLPPFHDPFAGGGSIPLEAQRLGLEAHATDLNPVAVLINKAMIEIPPKFAGRPPVGPIPKGEKQTKATATEDWSGARGLAEDVRRYGAWMREEAEKRIGHLYPKVKITKGMVKERPELKSYENQELTTIAWIWARTVASPNPAARGAHVPLVASFWLSKKPGKETWVEPRFGAGRELRFSIMTGKGGPKLTGTIEKSGAICALSEAAIPFRYIRDEAKAGRLGYRLMAVVAEGERGRVYVSSDATHDAAASVGHPKLPLLRLPDAALGFRVQEYGITAWNQLFSPRQLTFLKTCSDLVREARERVKVDCAALGFPEGARLFEDKTATGASAYADAVGVYLSFLVDKLTESSSLLCTWSSAPKNELVVSTFRRHALSMTWDYAEANPFGDSSGSITKTVGAIERAIQYLPARGVGVAEQLAAQAIDGRPAASVISTDPPYYDNIGYADLSDFFYYWLRQSHGSRDPLFATMLVPKEQELIASPHRHPNTNVANQFFLEGMTEALRLVGAETAKGSPVSIYYAFKQSETDDGDGGTASTGWESFLEAVVTAGLTVTGTWPIRTERTGRTRDIGANALASSIVLVCRSRPATAQSVSRRHFLRELEQTLPVALVEMTSDPEAAIAPVDLQQASIGPGMAVFSKYKAVLEADGSPMTVHSALVHINKAIDDHFAHAEGDLDADTRFCIGWFQQYGFEIGPFGEADVLARAKGTSVDGVKHAGVLEAAKGKVRLRGVKDYPKGWDPAKDERIPVWEACHQMCRALGESEQAAGKLLARMPEKQDAIRQLAYRLYTLCERKKWAEEARAYNELVSSWPAIVEESQKAGLKGEQLELLA